MKAKSRKVCVIGLDGATFDVIGPLLKRGELPNLQMLMTNGSYGRLLSTIHPFSAQAWSSFMTGKGPGKHGIFDFTHHVAENYGTRFVNASERKAASLWGILSQNNKDVVVVNVPLTYPPERVRGILISGMDAPGIKSDFGYPEGICSELNDKLGEYVIEVSVRDYIRAGRPQAFLEKTEEAMEIQARWVKYLIKNRPWDLFVYVCRATDQVQHFFWKYVDSHHPFHDPNASPVLKEAIARIYRKADGQIGEFLNAVGEDATVVIMSDHGQGANGDKSLYLNKWLRAQGLLKFCREDKKVSSDSASLLLRSNMLFGGVEFLKKRVPRRVKEFLLNRVPSIKDRLETASSFMGVDWSRTKAYSEELRGNIWINLKGRQAQGIVNPGTEYEAVREDIIKRLECMIDPETGERIVGKVYRREELYSGPHVPTAPDIVFTQSDEHYSYVLRRSNPNESIDTWVKRLDEKTNGCWPNASHRLDGIVIMKGRDIRHGVELQGASMWIWPRQFST